MRFRLPNFSFRKVSVKTSRGFTLLEVLVSIAVLGMGLAVIMQGLALGLRVRRDSAESLRLGLVAEQRLQQLFAQGTVDPGDEEGEEQGYTWRVEVVPPSEPEGGKGALVEVRLMVESPAGRKRELRTLMPESEGNAQP
jgi:prepilin-type N-terminal cleavage/methylation domain-containing protein